jgi:hypothetical protein
MDSLSRSIRATLADDAPDKLYKLPKTASYHGCHCDLSRHPLRRTSPSSTATLRPTTCLRYAAATRRSGRVALRSTADAQVGRGSRVLYALPAAPEDGESRQEACVTCWTSESLRHARCQNVRRNSVLCVSEVQ